ncbi:MAG: hypothetical protein J0L75_11720 [Spirochaetes bacterium]|nr:hypothetical protein [Spirochaetota bacterium]
MRRPLRLTFLAACVTVALSAADWKANAFPPSDRIVKNPHCGFVFMPMLETVDKYPDWVLDLVTTAYFRIPWDETVNEKGEYDFDRLDTQFFSGFTKRGLRLALRIMPLNRYSAKPCIFPREARGKGIPFIKLTLTPGKVHESPVYWSEAYLKEHGRLMEALGAWARKHPELDHVDLGGMGEFGENHFDRWTEAQKAEAGYSEAVWLEAMVRLMEQAEEALPRVARAICVSPFSGPTEPMFRLITERAVRRGWWLRTDSFTERGPAVVTAPFFERFHWRTPWILEASGGINRGYFGEPIPLPKYFEAVQKFQPHVVNLMGMWDLRKLVPEERAFLGEQGKRIGYRLQIAKAVLPARVLVRSGEAPALPFSVTLAQNGAVPFMGEAVYRLRFTQEDKILYETTWVPEEPLSTLLPGQKRSERAYVALPAGFPAKPTRLSLALRDLSQGGLLPDNAAVEAGGFVSLGTFGFEAAAKGSGGGEILSQFAEAALPEGMERVKSADGWILRGREDKAWSYASFPGPDLAPGAAYVMKVSVRAWKSEIADSSLKFKIGVKKPGEDRVRNYNTELYDFTRAGEWQELTLTYQPKEAEKIGLFAVEKSRTAPSTLHAELRSWTLEARPLAPLE